MKLSRWIVAAVVAGAAMVVSGPSAFAQVAGPPSLQYTPRPTVSPYVNLFNDPNGYGVYQTLVRPFQNQYDINARQATNINQLQQQLNQVRSGSGLGTTGGGRIRPTGHASTFMNLSHFYSGNVVR